MCATTMARLVGVVSDPAEVVRLGKALPLLCAVIKTCGRGSSCDISYGDVSEELGVSYPTIKAWASDLAKKGYIEKTTSGAKGVVVTLGERLLNGVDALAGLNETVQGIVDAVHAVRIALDNSMKGALVAIERQRKRLQ
ncbi:MAG: hypothetical protein JXR37_17970 [Kiritimatiellae bacterium]|nr:hypothetical protein [Kiritimatiellia bacterium]